MPPELLKRLMEMGHGDTLVIGDGNFPGAALAGQDRLVRCDGCGTAEVLDAILKLMPLDTFVPAPVGLMEVVPGDDYEPVVWEKYKAIIARHAGRSVQTELIERQAFYDRTRGACCVIATSESARYANILLTKGIIEE
jgi:L-fucose mutarotase